MHLSEPNYVVSVGWEFWGMGDDDLYSIPSKCVQWHSYTPCILTLHLLKAKNISWASYRESILFDGYEGFNIRENVPR